MRLSTPLLACDDCGARRQGKQGSTFADLRQLLAAVGWKSDHARERDLCPACLARGAA